MSRQAHERKGYDGQVREFEPHEVGVQIPHRIHPEVPRRNRCHAIRKWLADFKLRTSPAEKCQIALRFRGAYRGETYAPAASARLDAHELLPHSRCMRTTLVIEDDVLEAARSLAEAEGKSVGEVISTLARRGLARRDRCQAIRK